MTKVVVGLFVLCKNMWDSQSGGEEVLKEIFIWYCGDLISRVLEPKVFNAQIIKNLGQAFKKVDQIYQSEYKVLCELK